MFGYESNQKEQRINDKRQERIDEKTHLSAKNVIKTHQMDVKHGKLLLCHNSTWSNNWRTTLQDTSYLKFLKDQDIPPYKKEDSKHESQTKCHCCLKISTRKRKKKKDEKVSYTFLPSVSKQKDFICMTEQAPYIATHLGHRWLQINFILI